MTDKGVSGQIIDIVVPQVIERIDFLRSVYLPVGVKNNSKFDTALIEKLALCFRSEAGKPTSQTTVVQQVSDFRIPPSRLDYAHVCFVPNLHFLTGTNQFDVSATIRWEHKKGLGAATTLVSPPPYPYIVIHEAPPLFGRAFISYKEPEDRQLADLLFAFLSKAGFVPYMAPRDLQPGSKLWEEKIPVAIRGSNLIFVIWTENAPKGEGVRKEIAIARAAHVSEAPLIERTTKVPPEYDGRGIEYTLFDRRHAALAFADVVMACRKNSL